MLGKIKTTHYQNLEDFDKLRYAWRALFDEQKTKSIFLTWEWLYAWWKAYKNIGTLWLVVIYRNDEVVGIAPLMLLHEWKNGIRFRVLRSLGYPNADESGFLVKDDSPEVVVAICEYVLANRSRWDVIDLHEYGMNQTVLQVIHATFNKAGMKLDVSYTTHLYVSITNEWDAYLKSLSKHSMQNIERRIRQVKKEYDFRFVRYKGEEILEEHLETMFHINENGAYTDKYESKSERAMHYELLQLIRDRGWMEVTFIFLNDKPVAFEYGFNMNGRFEDWRASFDHNYSKQGLGKSLLYLLMQTVFAGGYHEFDFLRGEYSHKSEWNPSRREFVNTIAVKPWHLPARLAFFVFPTIAKNFKERFSFIFSKTNRNNKTPS